MNQHIIKTIRAFLRERHDHDTVEDIIASFKHMEEQRLGIYLVQPSNTTLKPLNLGLAKGGGWVLQDTVDPQAFGLYRSNGVLQANGKKLEDINKALRKQAVIDSKTRTAFRRWLDENFTEVVTFPARRNAPLGKWMIRNAKAVFDMYYDEWRLKGDLEGTPMFVEGADLFKNAERRVNENE